MAKKVYTLKTRTICKTGETELTYDTEFETVEEATEAYRKLMRNYAKCAILFAKSYFANKVLIVALIISVLYNIFGG